MLSLFNFPRLILSSGNYDKNKNTVIHRIVNLLSVFCLCDFPHLSISPICYCLKTLRHRNISNLFSIREW